MPGRFPEITELQETLEELLKAERDAQVKRRIHLLVLIRSGQVKTRTAAAKHLAVHRNSIRAWLELYASGGLERLLRIERPAPPSVQRSMPEAVFQAFQERLAAGGFPDGYVQAQRWLKDEFHLDIRYKTLHRITRYRLKAKLKRARPSHEKKTRVTSPPFQTA